MLIMSSNPFNRKSIYIVGILPVSIELRLNEQVISTSTSLNEICVPRTTQITYLMAHWSSHIQAKRLSFINVALNWMNKQKQILSFEMRNVSNNLRITRIH